MKFFNYHVVAASCYISIIDCCAAAACVWWNSCPYKIINAIMQMTEKLSDYDNFIQVHGNFVVDARSACLSIS